MKTPKISIQFPSNSDLKTFMRAIVIDGYNINFTRFILTFLCTEEQQELAVEIYNGRVIKYNADNRL